MGLTSRHGSSFHFAAARTCLASSPRLQRRREGASLREKRWTDGFPSSARVVAQLGRSVHPDCLLTTRRAPDLFFLRYKLPLLYNGSLALLHVGSVRGEKVGGTTVEAQGRDACGGEFAERRGKGPAPAHHTTEREHVELHHPPSEKHPRRSQLQANPGILHGAFLHSPSVSCAALKHLPHHLSPQTHTAHSLTSSPPSLRRRHNASTQIARIVKTYDSTCACCQGTGTLKTRRFSSSRFRKVKGVSCKCMMCGGVGYVRMCTTRVEPDFSKDDSMPAEYRPGEKKEEGPPRLTIK